MESETEASGFLRGGHLARALNFIKTPNENKSKEEKSEVERAVHNP